MPPNSPAAYEPQHQGQAQEREYGKAADAMPVGMQLTLRLTAEQRPGLGSVGRCLPQIGPNGEPVLRVSAVRDVRLGRSAAGVSGGTVQTV